MNLPNDTVVGIDTPVVTHLGVGGHDRGQRKVFQGVAAHAILGPRTRHR